MENKVTYAQNQASDMASSDFEAIRDHLIVRAVNKHHKGLGVYEEQAGDVVLGLYLLLTDITGKQFVTGGVSQEMLQRWGVDMTTAMKVAMLNTADRWPAIVMSISANQGVPLLNNEDLNWEDTNVFPEMGGGRLITCNGKNPNGATAMFYPGVLDKLYELMGGKFTIVFANTVDTFVLPDDETNVKKLLMIGSSKNAYGDVLSKQAYTYDGKTLAVRKAD